MEGAEVDVFHLDRLQAFNDAVFAIVATILVLPVRKLEETGASEHVSLEEQLKHRWPQLVIYMVGFLMMCAVWESHVLRFRILSRVDDVMIWFNLTSLLFTSCLPFTCALEGTFTSKGTPMALVCGNLITLEILEVIMIVYAFRQPRLLAQEFDTLTQDEMRQRMKLMLIKKAVIASLYVLAGLLSFLQKPLALVVAAVVTVSPWINRLVGVTYRKWSHIRLTDSEFDRMFGNFIDKERVEFFSDGVFAIVSTLLILDVTVEDFPTKAEVSSHGFVYTMQNVRPDISTYAVTFIVVALLWFTHHSLFNYIHTLNQVMLILNNLSLAFLGLFPLINATLDRYAGRGKPDSRLALQAAASIVFMAGISQGVVFIIAIWKGPTDPESQENPREDPRFRCTAHSYLAFKLATIPLMTLGVYFWATFGPNTSFSVDVYYIAGGLTPVLFILLKLVLSCLQRVHYRRSFQIREENWTIVTHDLESEDYPRVV